MLWRQDGCTHHGEIGWLQAGYAALRVIGGGMSIEHGPWLARGRAPHSRSSSKLPYR